MDYRIKYRAEYTNYGEPFDKYDVYLYNKNKKRELVKTFEDESSAELFIELQNIKDQIKRLTEIVYSRP